MRSFSCLQVTCRPSHSDLAARCSLLHPPSPDTPPSSSCPEPPCGSATVLQEACLCSRSLGLPCPLTEGARAVLGRRLHSLKRQGPVWGLSTCSVLQPWGLHTVGPP